MTAELEEEYSPEKEPSVKFLEWYELENITNPSTLFESIEELTKFINIYNEEDSLEDRIKQLEIMLGKCERQELYEYCQIIVNKINNLKELK